MHPGTWTACCSSGPRIVLFNYDASRAGTIPRRLLEGYRGILVTDGYEAYDAAARTLILTHAGCFAQYPASGFIWSKDPMSLQ